VQQALAVSNPDVAPHVRFADLGGHGFATVRVTPDALDTEFVAIPRPLERIDRPDGGPLAYRVVHRVKRSMLNGSSSPGDAPSRTTCARSFPVIGPRVIPMRPWPVAT